MHELIGVDGFSPSQSCYSVWSSDLDAQKSLCLMSNKNVDFGFETLPSSFTESESVVVQRL